MSQLIIPLKIDQATADSISAKAPIADPTFTTGITTPKAALSGMPNTPVLVGSGYSLTGVNAQSLMDFSGVWNTAGTPTAFKLNITDTASNANSNLTDLQVGGVSKFRIDKTGTVFTNIISASQISGTYWIAGGGSILTAPINGNFLIQNNNQNDFGLLLFGGTVATFPAIKRSANGLQIRLADDSGFAPLTAGTLFLNDGTVKQVTYGAADSAGVGFKSLRIPN